MTENGSPQQPAINPDLDRHPDFAELLRRILQESNIPDGPIERLEVTTLASGEATYRWWTPRADEPEGGYLEAVE